jgi:hypothetical protein
LIDSCLERGSPSLQHSFGPVRAVLSPKSAKGHVESTSAVGNLLTLLGIMKSVVGSRLDGTYKRNPFFAPETGRPIAQPRELTKAERERVTNAA